MLLSSTLVIMHQSSVSLGFQKILEPFKMKKYKPNGVDEFGWHVDVTATGNNHRCLAFFLYLSNNEELRQVPISKDTTTDCEKYGSLSTYKALVSQRTKPIKEPKYFMGSYLHYVE